MKEYNKQQLHEYAKELFALCLEKGLYITAIFENGNIDVYEIGNCYISEDLFKYKLYETMPIWELIEKVKQL